VRISGLYVITADCAGGTAEMLERVQAVIEGGAAIVQYRDKSDDHPRRLREAWSIKELCQSAGAMFVVNDDVELAVRVRADGVHLGKDDGDIASARAALGECAFIGVSCYASLERAWAAQAARADYVAFGSFYASVTKPAAVRAPLELLAEAKRCLSVPLVAIGGIDASNAHSLIARGADAVAVLGSVFRAEDPRSAAEAIARLF
jgi:thiamine-phosphate pyrophosphorylase